MKTNKKILAFLLALVMLIAAVGTMTACSSNEEVSSAAQETEEVHIRGTIPPEKPALVVEGAKDVPAPRDGYPEDPGEHVQALMESGMDRMDAIKSAAKERGMSKGAFYKLLLGASGEE